MAERQLPLQSTIDVPCGCGKCIDCEFGNGRKVIRVRGRSSEAQRCPICMGRGIMPSTFYQPIVGTTSAIVDEPCRSCDGKGIVIVDV